MDVVKCERCHRTSVKSDIITIEDDGGYTFYACLFHRASVEATECVWRDEWYYEYDDEAV